MLLDQFLFEVTTHYRSRGFPETAIEHLRWVLVSNASREGTIVLNTAYPGCKKSVSELIGQFAPEKRIDVTGHEKEVKAIYGFSFGYRMLTWPAGASSTDSDIVAKYRLPGFNNAALAEQARVLQLELKVPLFLQFEIADSIGGSAAGVFTSKRIDQGTYRVAEDFDAKRKEMGVNTVVIVAHRHHFERCRVILERKFNIVGLSPRDFYSGYDPGEAQPRVMSATEYIVNDFASMSGMA